MRRTFLHRALAAVLLALTLCGVSLAQSSASSPIEVSAHVDRSHVLLGETVVLTVDASYPPTLDVGLPSADKLNFSPFEVRDAVMTPLPLSGGRKHVRYTVRLAGDELGAQTVPSMSIDYKTADGTTHTAQSTPLQVEVVAAPPAPGEKADSLRDLKNLDTVPMPAWVYVAAGALGVLALLAIGALVRSLLRRRQRKHAPPLTPHEIALAALDRLLAANLPACGQLKAHYDTLASVLREYLAQRFDLPVLEHTTAEVVAMMRDRSFEEALRMDVRHVLDEADLVKFAKLQVPIERAYAQVAEVRAIVERTIPAPPSDGDGKPMSERPAQPPAAAPAASSSSLHGKER